MKRLLLILALLTSPAFACWQCGPRFTCVASSNGGCKCVIDPGVSCIPCGSCASDHCYVNCIQGPQPYATRKMGSEPWVNDHKLVDGLSASPVMQAIVPVIQKHLIAGDNVLHVASGAYILSGGKEYEFSTWQSPGGSVTLRAKDPAQSKLVITDKGWTLYQHGKRVADGQ